MVNQTTEISHLQDLAINKTLTAQDLVPLQKMLANDSVASDELQEIAVMTQYHEYLHAGHGLGFLADYLQNGRLPLCPDHALAHYYVLKSHGEDQLAATALAAARADFPAWQARIKPDPATNVDEQTIRQAASYFEKYDSSIAAGNETITPSELNFLTFLGDICVR